jgi:hypothetical protein
MRITPPTPHAFFSYIRVNGARCSWKTFPVYKKTDSSENNRTIFVYLHQIMRLTNKKSLEKLKKKNRGNVPLSSVWSETDDFYSRLLSG